MPALERLLKQHYRREVYGIHAAPDLWQRLQPRLGAQEKASPMQRILGATAERLSAPWGLRTVGYIVAGACLLAVTIPVSGLLTGPPRAGSTTGLALSSTTVTPAGPDPGETPLESYGLSAGTTAPGRPSTDPRATDLPSSGEGAEPTPAPTPAAQAAPVLSVGTLEEADEAIGVSIVLPSYLPAGTEREEDLVRYQAQDGHGYAAIGYRVGARYLAVSYLTTLAPEVPLPDGEPVTVGPFEAVNSTQPREPSDPLPPVSEIVWRDGHALVRVSGDLPAAEVLKVAGSLYR